VQRVTEANVVVDGEVVGEIGAGLVVFVGVAPEDTPADASALAAKVAGLRIFRDEGEKMNLAVTDVGGEILVISQFTLYGNARRGRRPSFGEAAPAATAEPLIGELIAELDRRGIGTAGGRFGADMAVSLVNDGPVTLVLEIAGGRVV